MGILELILISLGLSMDAFAVSITLGLSVQKPKTIEILIPGLYFGFFQAFMTFIGNFAGTLFLIKIQFLDHWIAFILLCFIGGKMIWESFKKTDNTIDKQQFKFFNMLLLAVATSIDALAVGITLPFFNINIYHAVVLIGAVTFFISIAGVMVGNICGIKFKSRAEIAGGTILIMLGIKILIEHLF